MRKYIILFITVSIIGCTAPKNTVDYKKISQKEFLETPFGFDENIENFTNLEKPRFKTQKLLRKNKHYPEKTDTIYQLTYKKSEIFFYKTYLGKEFLLAGKVLNKEIHLKNSIQVGMYKDQFIDRFSDELKFKADSLQLIGEGTRYTFIFTKNKLSRINIDNYFD
ncbi:MAG TPA: hypothetical protein DCG75_00900 [Bacteroidales bacterium]|jgi:hypothetical protein|nr:hypothetical protein [Bacteroidales bacterium]